MDLTKNPNCYTYHIVHMHPSLSKLYYSDTITFNAMLKIVESTVMKVKNTPARARFIRALISCSNKRDIFNLCHNAIERGKNYQG